MALFNILMIILALHREDEEYNNFNEMVMAADYMKDAIDVLESYKDQNIEYKSIGESFGYKLLGTDSTGFILTESNDMIFDKDECAKDPYGYNSYGCIECYDYGEDKCKDGFERLNDKGKNLCYTTLDTIIDLHGDNFYDAGSDGLLDERENGCIEELKSYSNSNPDTLNYNEVLKHLEIDSDSLLYYAYLYSGEQDSSVICGKKWWDEKDDSWLKENKRCPSCDADDPNGDNYDIVNNESGTQGNEVWDENEGTEGNSLCEKDENDWNNFKSKLSALNPNLAAVLTDEFISLGLDSESVAAIAFTGSYPGANIAVLSACKTLKIKTRVISSIGASRFGATDPLFSWKDMQFILDESDVFHIDTAMYSYSAADRKVFEGRAGAEKVFERIIERNDASLTISTHDEHIAFYKQEAEKVDRDIDVYINVGGNFISPRSIDIRDAIRYNKSKDDRINTIKIDQAFSPIKSEIDGRFKNKKNYKLEEEVFYTFLNTKVPIFNIDNLRYFTSVYNLPWPHKNRNFTTESTPGIYSRELKYDKKNVIMALVLSILNIIIIGVYSYKEINKRMLSSDPETIL